MLEILGWDVQNKQNALPGFEEVGHEDSIRIEGKIKAPDYSLKIARQRFFFLEAKKPSVFIKEDVSAAYQIRMYGYSAGLPLCILSAF